MFPTEIWEQILENTEAITLVRLRTVNSIFNAIITKHLQVSDAWYKQCRDDIPEKYWLMLLENSFYSTTLQLVTDNKDDKFNNKLWLTMYRAWIKWQNVQNFNVCTTNKLEIIPKHRPSEHITCCAVLGELVAVGSSEGYIRILNLRTNKLVFRVDQYKHVMDVKLCAYGKAREKIVLIATLLFNKVSVWDITSQKSIMFTNGNVICAGYGYYCTSLHHENINVCDSTTEGCLPTRLFIKDFNITKTNTNHHNSLTSNMKYAAMAINRHELCFLSDTGLFGELDLQDISRSANLRHLTYTPDITHIGVPKSQKVYKYYLFNPHIAFCTTERGYLGISIHKSKWQMYNVYPLLEGTVTAILFYVRVLVIGLNTGDVCLFSCENEKALKRIDFQSKKSKRIHVSSEPIVSINIMEISGDQRLLVATKNIIYQIKFDHVD